MNSSATESGRHTIRSLGTILTVWAHPDDETYLAGGLMAAARDHGARVVCRTASAGEYGTADPDGWPPERLGPVRRWESAAAMAVLGVRDHEVAAFRDGALDGHDDEGRAWADELLTAVEPDTIVTFGPEGMTFHPDHIAVHRWVTGAWADAGRPCRLLYAVPLAEKLARFGELYEEWQIYMTDARPDGTLRADLDLHVHLTGHGLERKLTALRAMATQTAPLFVELGDEVMGELVAEEAYLSATG